MSNYIICLETSAALCSVALSSNGLCIEYIESKEAMSHSKEITLLINQCLNNANISIKELNAVCISSGPGSYTGLRVASSCAKAMCYALDIPLIAIDTLTIVAEPIYRAKEASEYIIPLIDARRDEVYYCVFDSSLNRIEPIDNLILDTESFIKYKRADICGDGAQKAEKLLMNQNFSYFTDPPMAKNMVNLAKTRYIEDKFEDLAYFNPIYHKSPNISQSNKPLF